MRGDEAPRLTRPSPPAETGSFPLGVRGASEVHDALNKARHVCERRRDREAAVSCENKAGGRFQHPAKSGCVETISFIKSVNGIGAATRPGCAMRARPWSSTSISVRIGALPTPGIRAHLAQAAFRAPTQ